MNLLRRIQGLDLIDKVAIVLGVIVGVPILLGIWIYWLSGVTPRRPKTVAADAVFLWAPAVGFPGGLPRRGDWLSCSLNRDGRNRCKLSDIDGKTEYEDEFVSYSNRGSLPADELHIDPIKSREHQVWIGEALVPLIYLRSGEILIPMNAYEQGTAVLRAQNPLH